MAAIEQLQLAHEKVMKTNEEIVKFLLEYGASPSEPCLRVNIYSEGFKFIVLLIYQWIS